ncbi:MAG TPA: tetratricopeptide repeat protein [Verrucomicrobiae bacterium]|nr:tetratricopeptide repeat protein [Verrucomicrobiae bacterium]
MNTTSDFETAKKFFVEGLRLLEANNLLAAEQQFTRSLEIIPDRVSTLNNLSAIKIRLEKFPEARELALKAIAAGDQSPEAWSNLGIALTATKRYEEALQAYGRALDCNPAHARAWFNKAMTLFELTRYDEALLACDQALKLDSSQHEILYGKGRILKELGRVGEARKVYAESLEMRTASCPVYLTERLSKQRADILVVSHNPDLDGSLKSFDNLHRHCSNYPGQLADVFHEDFHFTFVFEGIATRPSSRDKIPQPDFLINNCANGDLLLARDSLLELTDLLDSFGVPVVNHPVQAVQSTRDASARLLKDVPGVLLPKTGRFSSAGKTPEELAQEIENQFDYPLITRTLYSQQGKGMARVDSRESLLEVISSGLPENFFVTQFVDSRVDSPFYRKIRAAVVKEEVIITRVDYHSDWNVHGRKSPKRVPFYLENMYLLDEEKRICANPEKELGRSAIQALQAIRSRIPLDVFGVDFDVDARGLLIFYEANATMNLLSTAQKEVPNPKEPEDRLRLAFRKYLTSLAVHH